MIGVDSSILVDLLRGKLATGKLGRFLEEGLCTSEIVVYEILYGVYKAEHFSEKQLEECEAMIDAFSYVFPIGRTASMMAAKIAGKLAKAGQTIQHSDSLIAGSLLANGCQKIITKNVKDFERIKELEVIAF